MARATQTRNAVAILILANMSVAQRWVCFEEFAIDLLDAQNKADFVYVRRLWKQLYDLVPYSIDPSTKDVWLYVSVDENNDLVWPRADQVWQYAHRI